MSRKLQRPPVPHAEATLKLRGMSPEQARQTFVASGILTKAWRQREQADRCRCLIW